MDDGAFYILALLLVATVVGLTVRRTIKGSSTPPFPPGPKPLPIIGNMFDVPSDPRWVGFNELSKKYGDIFSMQVLGQRMIILGSAEVVFDLLEKRSAIYSDRPNLPMASLMGWGWALSLMPYGSIWRQRRREFHQHFNNSAILDYSAIMEQQQTCLLEDLLHYPENFLSHIHLLFGASIFKVVYGIDIKDSSDTYLHTAKKSMEGLAETLVPGKYAIDFLPFLKYIPTWVHGPRFPKVAAKYRPFIAALREIPYNVAHDAWARDPETVSVVAKMSNELDQVDIEVAKDVAGIGFVGGADTSTSAAQLFFLAMALHPDVQRKAQMELDAIVGPHRLPLYADRSSLPYIDAIVKECLRWQPVGPLAIAHKTTADDEYKGYFIPKGAMVVTNTWAILHDTKMYPDPERFIPDRFIKDGQLNPEIRDPNTAAFGYGRRICPGRWFAEMGLFLTIASVLHVFNVSPPLDEDGQSVGLQVRMTSSVVSYPEPFECIVKPRSEAMIALINQAK